MKFFGLFPLAASLVVASQDLACPTITSHSRCSTCVVPMCLQLSTISVPCGCATPLATSVVDHLCSEPCYGGCGGTSYSLIVKPTCSSSSTTATTTTTTKSCPVVTTTVTSPGCKPTPPPGGKICVHPNCIEAKTVTVPCSCVRDLPLKTSTVTAACTCRSGCATTTKLAYLPCPITAPAPSPLTTSLSSGQDQ